MGPLRIGKDHCPYCTGAGPALCGARGKSVHIPLDGGADGLEDGGGFRVPRLALGVADEEWIAAVTAQLGNVQHISNLFYTAPAAQLAARGFAAVIDTSDGVGGTLTVIGSATMVILR